MIGILKSARRNMQRGGIILMVAGSLVMVAGMTALAVDVGRVMVVRNELQNVADAAAISGAGRIGDIFSQDWDAACTAAEAVIASNGVEGESLVPGDYTIQTGVWSYTTRTFTSVVDCDAGPVVIADIPSDSFPAIRVLAERTGTSATGSLQMFFAPVIGTDSVGLAADAIAAVAASGSAKPGLPFAMSNCMLDHLIIPEGEPGAGGLEVGKTFSVFSAQFNKTEDEIDSDKSITCSATQGVGQWTPFCDDPGCESANEVAKLLDNPEDAPIFEDELILTDLKNGRVQSLFNILNGILDALPSGEKLIVLVPIVDASLMGNGETGVATIQNFVSLEVTNVAKKKPDGYTSGGAIPYIEFKVASPKKFVAGTPDMGGSPYSGVITKAFLVN